MLECGVAKAVITPDKPVRMAGYADRKGPYDGKYEDIFLRALYLKDGWGKRCVVISADLIWWNPDMMPLLERELKSIGYMMNEVVFTATHTHSGPGNGNAFIPPLETGDPEYMEKLARIASSAIIEAEDNAESVQMKIGKSNAPLNADRRVIVDGAVQMKPNYSAVPDTLMTAISFWSGSNLKAALIHYPCHANLAHENMLQRDYPGILEDYAEDAFPGSMVLFLQGATGDMRPNSVLGDKFVPGDREKVIAFGKEAGFHAVSAIRKSIAASGDAIAITSASAELPVTDDYSVSIDDDTKAFWDEWVEKKGRPQSETLTAKRISIGSQDMLFVNAEIVRSYAQYARELSLGCILSGYSDGMIGYIPNDRQIEEGGYEPVGSAPYFAIAGRFAAGTEATVRNLIKEVLS